MAKIAQADAVAVPSNVTPHVASTGLSVLYKPAEIIVECGAYEPFDTTENTF